MAPSQALRVSVTTRAATSAGSISPAQSRSRVPKATRDTATPSTSINRPA